MAQKELKKFLAGLSIVSLLSGAGLTLGSGNAYGGSG